MPYSGPGDPKLPDNVKKLSEQKREQWVGAWNGAYEDCQSDDGDDCEGRAFAVANAAVKERDTLTAQGNLVVNQDGETVQEFEHPRQAHQFVKEQTIEKLRDKGLGSGAITFTELDEQRSAWAAIDKMYEDLADFTMLMSNIMFSDVEDKPMAIRQLATEFATRVDNVTTNIETKEVGIVDKLKNVFKKEDAQKELKPSQSSNFFILKDEAGNYYWLARYSNNLLDKEDEIISDTSHKKFAALVKSGLVDPPDLWFWHRPEWKWGTGIDVAYDDAGFAVAFGAVDKGCEPLAEQIMSQPDGTFLVSHGMPIWSVAYDKENAGVIVEHITKEVSPLPGWAAANQFTGFMILEDSEMAFSKEDKARLSTQHGISKELLDRLEQMNATQAKEAAEAGILSKEEEVVAEEATTADAEQVEQPEEAEVTEPAVESEPSETQDALMVALKSIQALGERVEELTKEVAEMKRSDDEKISDKAKQTPLASLAHSIAASVIGQEATRVDGRTSFGKMAPKEVEAPENYPSVTGIPWIDKMMSEGK